MKPRTLIPVLLAAIALTASCAKDESTPRAASSGAAPAAESAPAAQQGQAAVQDDQSQKDVVKIAVGSSDHTTLVAALKAADLVDALSNAGPFTVFAPVNAAFDKLPKGTLDNLLQPANKDQLRTVLYHHVTVPVYEPPSLTDGQSLSMVDGGALKISKRGADTFIGDAKILGSVRGSNGIVYVIDAVLVPAK